MVRNGNVVWAASGSKLIVFGLPALNVLHTNAPDWKPEDVAVKFRPH